MTDKLYKEEILRVIVSLLKQNPTDTYKIAAKMLQNIRNVGMDQQMMIVDDCFNTENIS